MRRIFLYLAFPIFVCTCGLAEESRDGYAELSLMRYNVPFTIQAPDSAKVVSSSLSGVMKDVTIKSPADRFDVQILSSRASTNDMARLKSEQLDAVRDNRYFNRIVSEEANGFIFENKIDSSSLYGFRYIRYANDQEFVFQNSLGGSYTEEEIRKMYEAVKEQQ